METRNKFFKELINSDTPIIRPKNYVLRENIFRLKLDNKKIDTFGSIKLKKYAGNNYDNILCIILYDEKKTPLFISISTTFMSSDGEYRYNCLPYKNYLDYINEHVEAEYIENVLYFIKQGKPVFEENNSKLIDPYIILVVFFIEYQRYTYDVGFMNLSFNFDDLLRPQILYDENPEDKIMKKLDFLNTDSIYLDDLTYFRILRDTILTHDYESIMIGFKLSPVLQKFANVKSFKSFENKIFVELFIRKKVNLLIINNRTDCLSYTGKNSFLKMDKDESSYKKLYELDTSLTKYTNTPIVGNIIENLRKAKEYTFIDKSDIFINNSFKEAHDYIRSTEVKIFDILIYSMYVSNISLCVHEGRTFDTMVQMEINDALASDQEAILNIKDLFSLFHLFKIIYTLYCLNLGGIIHNDLHLNNIIARKFYKFKTINYDIFDCYCVGSSGKKINMKVDENNYFMGRKYEINSNTPEMIFYLKRNFKMGKGDVLLLDYNPVIIDFSRSILMFGEEEVETLDKVKTNSIQRSKIKENYKIFFPEFYKKNKDLLVKKMLSDYKTFLINIYSAIDIYRFLFLFLSKYGDISPEELDDKVKNVCILIKDEAEDVLLFRKEIKENFNLHLLRNEVFDKLRKKKKINGDIFYSEMPYLFNDNEYVNLPTEFKIEKDFNTAYEDYDKFEKYIYKYYIKEQDGK